MIPWGEIYRPTIHTSWDSRRAFNPALRNSMDCTTALCQLESMKRLQLSEARREAESLQQELAKAKAGAGASKMEQSDVDLILMATLSCVEDGKDARDRPTTDRASGADEPRRVHGTHAAVATRADRHRRPSLQTHHAHLVCTGTCSLQKHGVTQNATYQYAPGTSHACH